MNLTPDSPELTAFALGELPEAQAAAVAKLVAADPLLQAEVESIRRFTSALAADLALEPVAGLTLEQRGAIASAAADAAAPVQLAARPRPSRRQDEGGGWVWIRWLLQPGFGIALAGAAALTLALVVWPRLRQQQEETFETLRYGGGPAVAMQEAAPLEPLSADEQGSSGAPAAAPLTAPAAAPKIQAGAVRGGDPQSAGAAPSTRGVVPPSPASARANLPGQASGSPAIASAPMTRAPGLMPDGAPASTPVSAARRPANALAPDNAPAVAVAPSATDPALMKRYGAPAGGVGAIEAGQASPVRELRDRGELREEPVRGLRPALPPTGETYRAVVENPFRTVLEARLSTFGLDVDTASYANVRRFLREGVVPPANAVRVEEMINYFPYTYPPVRGDHPVAAQVDVAESPWKPGNQLVRVAIKARDVPRAERPAANLVFLVDVSGSMEPENKLPLVKRALRMVVDRMTARDSVAIVTYAGDAGIALKPSNGAEKQPLFAAIDALKAGGSTHGSAGIRLAYALARTNLVRDGVNRVVLCTDGDFNVGVTSQAELLDLIAAEARDGVALTVLGFGMGNYNDATTEILANRGNGTYAYIDSFREAQKVLSAELESTLVTVAKDVKLQVEFNPARVASWRLIGYENRLLADRDFNDDTKDAGDVGAGHTVTALYEIVPVGGGGPGVDPLRYQAPPAPAGAAHPDEMLYVKIRYKAPGSDTSRLFSLAVKGEPVAWGAAQADFRFAAAVAGFGMLLRDSAHRGAWTLEDVLRAAEGALGEDREGYRAEFVDLVRRARELRGGR